MINSIFFKRIILTLFLLLLINTNILAKDKSAIIFSNQPFTEQNIKFVNNKYFIEGERIYYLFVSTKPIKSEYIRVQAFKMSDKNSWGDVNILRRNDYRLMQDEKYYYSNYYTFYEKGRYVLQIFSIDNLQKPLAISDFWIK